MLWLLVACLAFAIVAVRLDRKIDWVMAELLEEDEEPLDPWPDVAPMWAEVGKSYAPLMGINRAPYAQVVESGTDLASVICPASSTIRNTQPYGVAVDALALHHVREGSD